MEVKSGLGQIKEQVVPLTPQARNRLIYFFNNLRLKNVKSQIHILFDFNVFVLFLLTSACHTFHAKMEVKM